MAAPHGFERRLHGRARYSIFVPHGHDGRLELPLILFLHGAGEIGSDGVKPTRVGLGPAIRRQEATFPYLTVFPQSRAGTWRAGSPDGDAALAILEQVRREFPVDPRRIHLTGISMGGFGAWSLAIARPELWASIVPICGGGDPRLAWRLKPLPCWAFHGDADDVVAVANSRNMIAALEAAGGQPRYTEFPGVGHNSWDRAYAMPELFAWIGEQVRD